MARPTLTVLDDGLFVRTYAHEIRPQSATFHRFVEAVARTGAFAKVRYLIPVRHLRIWEVEPPFDPVDESVVEVVPTTYFSGIADYLLRAAYVAPSNWPIIDRAVGNADLLWLRLPASNALLALTAARRSGVPYFGWLAGSVSDVAAAQNRPGPLGWAARAVGRAYDAVSELAARGGPVVRLDDELFASVVSETEVADTRARSAESRSTGPWHIMWSGRMAGEKGLPVLIEAVRLLLARDLPVKLELLGDGPARPSVERLLSALPADSIADYGYVGDRATYMELLRDGDVFVHPSAAEGVPKVLVEAMAAGLPVVATPAGAVTAILAGGARGVLVPSGDPAGLADTLAGLLADPRRRASLRSAGLDWAADRTAEAQARRLVAWLHGHFPGQFPTPSIGG